MNKKVIDFNFKFNIDAEIFLSEHSEGFISLKSNAGSDNQQFALLLLITALIMRNLANLSNSTKDEKLIEGVKEALENIFLYSQDYYNSDQSKDFKQGFELHLKCFQQGYNTFDLKEFGFGFFDLFNNNIPMLGFNSIFLLFKYLLDKELLEHSTINKIKILGIISSQLFGQVTSLNQNQSAYLVATNLYFDERNFVESFSL